MDLFLKKAMEEATHYDTEARNYLLQMPKYSMVFMQGRGWLNHCGQYPDDLSECKTVLRLAERSKSEVIQAPWDGKGMPPAGTICEANVPACVHRIDGVDGYAWRKVEVCKSGIPKAERECLVYDLETTASCWADEFRPERTPEQIAAEERDRVCSELWTIIAGPGDCHAAARRVYDAGYRLEVKP